MYLGTRRLVEALDNGEIVIEPAPRYINPASIDVHLGDTVAVYAVNHAGPFPRLLDIRRQHKLVEIKIPESGYILYPGVLYLGCTLETTKTSERYTPCLEGVSSNGRVGLQVHMTAGFGDPGYAGQWTLEMTVVQPLRIYRRMRIGQIFYSETDGAEPYQGRYQRAVGIVPSRGHLDSAGAND